MKNISCNCIHCNKPILINEKFYNLDGEPWCERCVDDSLSVVREGVFNGWLDYRVKNEEGAQNENN